jgi:hypothetical protein
MVQSATSCRARINLRKPYHEVMAQPDFFASKPCRNYGSEGFLRQPSAKTRSWSHVARRRDETSAFLRLAIGEQMFRTVHAARAWIADSAGFSTAQI